MIPSWRWVRSRDLTAGQCIEVNENFEIILFDLHMIADNMIETKLHVGSCKMNGIELRLLDTQMRELD